MHLDFLGNELSIGDKIVFADKNKYGLWLEEATIVSLHSVNVKVKTSRNFGNGFLKPYNHIIKIGKQ